MSIKANAVFLFSGWKPFIFQFPGYIYASYISVATSQINCLKEVDLEFHVHTTVEFSNLRGSLEILEDSLSWMWKIQTSPTIAQLIRGRAQRGLGFPGSPFKTPSSITSPVLPREV